jgi:16S rRNA U1498 N3-methylase RsmE
MILSASRSSAMILDVVDFKRSLNILEATEQKMPYALSGVGKNQNSDVLTRVWTEIALRRETSFKELLTLFYQDADKRVLEQIIETLNSMGVITITHANTDVKIRYKEGSNTSVDRLVREGKGGKK